MNDEFFMSKALEQAKISLAEGGVPVGAVMVQNDKIIASGYNKRVQDGNPVSHGETDCIKNCGRQKSYKDITIYTTLSPCIMCAGTIALMKMPRVVIGENINFGGNEELLKERGIKVDILQDENCIEMMSKFIKNNPTLWNEDIAEE